MTTKPGTSGTSTGVFSKVSHSASAALRVSSLAALREDQLDELHPRHRVEHVQADEALRAPARLRQPLDRQRGGRAREDRLGVEDRVQLAEQPRLDVVVLDDRLDHERGLRQRLRLGHDLDVLGVHLGAQAAQGLLHGRARALGRVVRAGEQQHRAVVGRGGGQAAGDGAAAGYRRGARSLWFLRRRAVLTDQSIYVL